MVEVQPLAGFLKIDTDLSPVRRRGVTVQVGRKPREAITDHRLEGLHVVPRAYGDPSRAVRLLQLLVIAQLSDQQQVPPAGHHAHRCLEGREGRRVIDLVPVVVFGVIDYCAPERFWLPDGDIVGIAQGQVIHRPAYSLGDDAGPQQTGQLGGFR
ncbi:Uncharacterised protein [Mycobacteroides abscessus subsp. abscessus]|nr:Uncharacterised protein [Mycobacteroides abscessus subsp. abscessus]SLE67825.1 Uncharacterised protein [Mycobacteroides abscessus subsp. massiliense]